MSIYDNIASAIIKQAGPLLDAYLPKIKAVFIEALDEYFKNHSTPVIPAPESPTTGPGVNDTIVIWDGDIIPDQMREAIPGIVGSDNELYYALFSTYGNHVWDKPEAVPELYARIDEIHSWFYDRVDKIGRQLLDNPGMTALLIAHDLNDRGACFMWKNIWDQLQGMGISVNRLIKGEVYHP
jgi:hypothetical protein